MVVGVVVGRVEGSVELEEDMSDEREGWDAGQLGEGTAWRAPTVLAVAMVCCMLEMKEAPGGTVYW